jgi:hypothetical protein
MKRVPPAFGLVILVPGLALGLALGTANADPPAGGEARAVGEFHAIDLTGTLEVEVTLGKPARVEITGEPDLLARVTTTVKGGTLVIDTKPKLPRHHHLRAIVSAPDLSALTISGTGAMKVTGVANDQLTLSLPGTGEIRVAGTTGALHLAVDGTGEVAAKDLAARDVTVEVNGTGSATVRASQSLEARVAGTGSIDVHGHPARVKKTVTGVGSIHLH